MIRTSGFLGGWGRKIDNKKSAMLINDVVANSSYHSVLSSGIKL